MFKDILFREIKIYNKLNKNYMDFLHKNTFDRILNDKIVFTNNLNLKDVYVLLNLNPYANRQLFYALLQASRNIKRKIFKGEIYPIVPLYVTSICQEHCVYCNYRVENNNEGIQRLRLSDSELAVEVEFLAAKGLRTIELVYATDPMIEVDDVIRHIKITHSILSKYDGGMVGINARPYSLEDYKRFREAGLDFAVLWQETYDMHNYKDYHPGNTEKADFLYRIDAHERMVQAGIKNIGLGILFGLSNWRRDWFMLIRHVDFLLRKFGEEINVIVGIPRLKPAVGAQLQRTPFIPNDAEFLLAVAVLNLVFPKALPWVTTRERWNLCLELAKGGGVCFTFDCKTIPGGYSLGRNGYQFPTFNFEVEQYISRLNEVELEPVFKWNFDSLPWKRSRKVS